MKLITLNIWGAHVNTPLLEFIESHRDIDIFCLQEVYHNAPYKISSEDRQVNLNIFSEIQQLLPDHVGFFRPVVENIFGLGIFVRNNIEVVKEGEVAIHENPHYCGRGPTHSRKLQWMECRSNDQTYAILNVHGLWNGMGKTDCPERIEQSQRIKAFLDSIPNPKILCGDLNLRPDTESLRMLESQMINLITSNQVTSTRTSLYPKPEKFADYILVSPEIKSKQFAVMREEVSDHAALYLDFV